MLARMELAAASGNASLSENQNWKLWRAGGFYLPNVAQLGSLSPKSYIELTRWGPLNDI